MSQMSRVSDIAVAVSVVIVTGLKSKCHCEAMCDLRYIHRCCRLLSSIVSTGVTPIKMWHVTALLERVTNIETNGDNSLAMKEVVILFDPFDTKQ